MAMVQFTLVPGTHRYVTFPEDLAEPFTLGALLAKEGIDSNKEGLSRRISVNDVITNDLETEIPPNGAIVIIAACIASA